MADIAARVSPNTDSEKCILQHLIFAYNLSVPYDKLRYLETLVYKGHFFESCGEFEEFSFSRKKACYENSFNTVLYSDTKLYYCEGYASVPEIPGFCIEHAFCLDKNGLVHDPTWGFSPGVAYYGIVYDFDRNAHLIFDDFTRNGCIQYYDSKAHDKFVPVKDLGYRQSYPFSKSVFSKFFV